jgi:hypothetical protein
MRANLVPAHPREALIEPFLGDGRTPSGLEIAIDHRIPPCLGRILAVGSQIQAFKPGDVVVFRPYSFAEASAAAGKVYSIPEDCVHAVLDGYDKEQSA